MKIVLIGPGIMSIPPENWGGVESLMWDFNNELISRGHEVVIVNTKDLDQAVELANSSNPDFVHLHYDVFSHIMPRIKCKNKAVTSHFPYLEHPDKRLGYEWIFSDFEKLASSEGTKIISLSDKIKDAFVNQEAPSKANYILPCGINVELFDFKPEPSLPNKSIYLAKIEPRKRQFMLQDSELNIDFAGPMADSRFHHQNKNYLGTLSKDEIYKNLTDYPNLILLSDGEGHARVCIEGLAAGLGLVVSEHATANLDTSLPFIDVISDSHMGDPAYLKNIIESNRATSISMRKEIREYCIKEFSWDSIISKYERIIKQ